MSQQSIPRPTLEELAAWFREGAGLERLRAGADWLVASAGAPRDPELESAIRDELREYLPALAGALAEVTARARRAFLFADAFETARCEITAWEVLCLRDSLEDLRESERDLFEGEGGAALEVFDASLEQVDLWLPELKARRLAESKRPGRAGRSWWQAHDPVVHELPDASIQKLARELKVEAFAPSEDDLMAFREGRLDGRTARIISRYLSREREQAIAETTQVMAPVVSLKYARERRLRTETGRVAAGGESEATEPQMRAGAMSVRFEEGEISVDYESSHEAVLWVRMGDISDFEVVLLRGAEPFAPTLQGRSEHGWWARIPDEKLAGATIRVRWATGAQEVVFEG